MASSLESNRSRTCCIVSGELVHPMSGSTALGEACSKSSTHDLVLAVPDCIAVLAGLYMRAVVMNGGTLWRISCVVGLAYRNRPRGQGRASGGAVPRERVAVPVRYGVRSGARGAARQMTRKEITLALKQMDGAYSLR